MNRPAPVRVTVTPPDHAFTQALAPLGRTAAANLDLAPWFDTVVLILDDLAADDRPWLTLRPSRQLTLYLHPAALAAGRVPGAMPDEDRPPWRLASLPATEPVWTADDLDAVTAQRWLHRQFLWARDLADASLAPVAVPPSLAEAFQEAWQVTVDGRLRRAHLPGVGEGECRIRFLRLFATGGVITPAHWQVFHELWSGDAATQADVLRRVRRLPPLRRHVT